MKIFKIIFKNFFEIFQNNFSKFFVGSSFSISISRKALFLTDVSMISKLTCLVNITRIIIVRFDKIPRQVTMNDDTIAIADIFLSNFSFSKHFERKFSIFLLNFYNENFFYLYLM